MWQRRSTSLLAGSALAGFGAWIDFLAILTLAAYEHRANAFLMAFISALFLVPGLLLSTHAGRWIDLGRPLCILAGSLALRAAATGLLLASPSMPMFCLLVALRSVFTVPTDLAGNVLVRSLVAPADVPRYFGMLGVLRNLSKIAAPALGAGLASRFGEASALGASVAMTVLAVLILAVGVGALKPVDARGDAAPATAPAPAKPDAAAPVVAGDTASVRTTLIQTMTVFSFMVFALNNQLPLLLHQGGFDKAVLGILVSCSGAGGVLAAAFIARAKPPLHAADPLRAALVAALACAGCFVLLGFAFQLPATAATVCAAVLFACTGMAGSVLAIKANTAVVTHFPQAVGAMSAALQAWQSGAMLVAPWLSALAVPYLSLSALLWVDGSLALGALCVVAMLLRRSVGDGKVHGEAQHSQG